MHILDISESGLLVHLNSLSSPSIPGMFLSLISNNFLVFAVLEQSYSPVIIEHYQSQHSGYTLFRWPLNVLRPSNEKNLSMPDRCPYQKLSAVELTIIPPLASVYSTQSFVNLSPPPSSHQQAGHVFGFFYNCS